MDNPLIPHNLLSFLKSLASESPLNIILLFLDGQERTVNQIAEAIGLGQPATSEHLAIMKQAGVLVSRKEGKEMYYCPDRARVLKALETLNRLLPAVAINPTRIFFKRHIGIFRYERRFR